MKSVTKLNEGLTYDKVKLKTAIKINGVPRSDITTLGADAVDVTISSNSTCVIISEGEKKTFVPFENVIWLEKQGS
jgi:hypothetical protein